MACHVEWTTKVVPTWHVGEDEGSVVTGRQSWIGGESKMFCEERVYLFVDLFLSLCPFLVFCFLELRKVLSLPTEVPLPLFPTRPFLPFLEDGDFLVVVVFGVVFFVDGALFWAPRLLFFAGVLALAFFLMLEVPFPSFWRRELSSAFRFLVWVATDDLIRSWIVFGSMVGSASSSMAVSVTAS